VAYWYCFKAEHHLATTAAEHVSISGDSKLHTLLHAMHRPCAVSTKASAGNTLCTTLVWP